PLPTSWRAETSLAGGSERWLASGIRGRFSMAGAAGRQGGESLEGGKASCASRAMPATKMNNEQTPGSACRKGVAQSDEPERSLTNINR
ncbi:hypothetical protein, partial [Pelomicrobium sp. G1]|uniref:hypothetical protein n=1 Tax=Pelomicrobium sp. G1 TaxID=3452920 RepID=UPI003F771495